MTYNDENKVYCWECKFLIKETRYCIIKNSVVNTCLKRCIDYECIH